MGNGDSPFLQQPLCHLFYLGCERFYCRQTVTRKVTMVDKVTMSHMDRNELCRNTQLVFPRGNEAATNLWQLLRGAEPERAPQIPFRAVDDGRGEPRMAPNESPSG